MFDRKAYSKKYNEENREKRKAYGKKHYEENREKKKAYLKKYREENKTYDKKYREENRDKILDQTIRRNFKRRCLIPREEVPKELVEAYVTLVKIKRFIKNQQEITS